MATSSRIVCVDDFEELACRNLPKAIYDYMASGADEEQTLNDNRNAFKRIRLRPRLMRDVSNRDISTTILGQKLATPISISPTALHKWFHPDGEKATAKAAEYADVGMVLSMWSTVSLEDVVKCAPEGVRWLHVDILENRDIFKQIVKRAETAGYKGLFVTLDMPTKGKKRKTWKLKGFDSIEFSYGHFDRTNLPKVDCSRTWSELDWIKSITKLPIVGKGILTAEDAREAVKHGVSGILVSNHGGRQLDGVLAAIDALPEVVEAVQGSGVEVYLDGGVRMGTDVLKALALGARAVFVGRPILWGLAYDGEDGVKHVLQVLRDEFDQAMALAGCRAVPEINSTLIQK